VAPLIIAHRGDSAHRPENTLASFVSALEVGADIVELDVQLTADGHVVVIHDATLDRTTNGHGPVAGLSLAALRELSAGFPDRFGDAYRDERIPTLAEVLALLKGRARVLVEIKKESIGEDAEGGIEAHTIEEVRKADMAGDVVFLSFERRALLRCRRLAPEIRRGHIFYRATPEEMIAGAREIASDLVMPHKGALSDALTRQAREASLKVATWVVDDPDELRSLARFELYAVGSNCPGLLIEALLENA
jgi:glycerophosphoryl diester phosphodiesterase